MNKNFLFYAMIVAVFFLMCGCAGLFFFTTSLKKELARTRSLLAKTESSARQLEEEKSRAVKENEKIQTDSLSFITLNNELRADKELLQARISNATKDIEAQKKELSRVERELKALNTASKAKQGAQKALLLEKEKMRSAIKTMEASIKRERAIYQYNLAVAYTKAMFIPKAVEAYEKSIGYDPANADAHFNLGMLYKGQANDPAKALQHLRKYLELKPDADDATDVLAVIDVLIREHGDQPSVINGH